MHIPIRTAWRRVETSDALFVVVAIVVGGSLGLASALGAKVGVAAAVLVLGGVVVARKPVYAGILAVVGMFFVQRLGGTSISAGSGGGLSYSDALLAGASFLAWPSLIGRPEASRIKITLLAAAAYLACLLPSEVMNPSKRAVMEFGHRVILVIGAVMVGAWIVREGYSRVALRVLFATAVLISVLAVENCLRHALQPASPLGLNKNFVGAQLATTLVVVIIARADLAISRRLWVGGSMALGAGLIASQSRGAMLGAAIGLFIAFVSGSRGITRGTKALAILVAAVLAWFAYTSIHAQLTATTQDLNNGSIGVRFSVEKVTRDIWRTSPVYGVGLKYFNTGVFGRLAQPANNVIDNELAESGLIGAAGFVLMQFVVVRNAFRRRKSSPLAMAGFAVVLSLLLHGMVDIYWTAATASLPFLILGMGLATNREDSRPVGEEHVVDSGQDLPPLKSRRRLGGGRAYHRATR